MKCTPEIDVQILKALLYDGRRSFTDLADELGTTKDVIWNHYTELKNNGVIVGSTVQLNFQKCGFTGVAMILLSVDSQDIASTLEHLTNLSGFGGFRHYNSPYNLSVITQLKSLNELEVSKQKISRQNKVNNMKTYFWCDVRNIPENIIPENFALGKAIRYSESKYVKKMVPLTSVNGDIVGIDDTDRQIIDKLTVHGRASFNSIAHEIGVSTDTVSNRYSILRKKNLVKVVVQVDPRTLGFQAILDLNIALNDPNELERVVDHASAIPGVSHLAKISGDFDLTITALVGDCNDIIRINKGIVEIPNIKKLEGTLRDLSRYPQWPGRRQFMSTF